MRTITPEEVVIIHAKLIDRFGGSHGIRDIGLLDSALHRPFATMLSVEAYPRLEEKAAALLHSLIKNHPFIDGNKRAGVTIFYRFLSINGVTLRLRRKELEDLAVAVAVGEIDEKEIVSWIENHIA